MLKLAIAAATAFFLNACTHIAYYTQAIGGHLQLMQAAQPIPLILQNPATAPGLREQLTKISAIREFASRELALPDNGSYRSYADLGRPYVVWNVFAAPKLSVRLEEWCLFFVGCVNYRGYYNRDAAERYARSLETEEGLETYVANIPAYSTLGFFDDPVLNTFLHFGELEVARTIFHELAHQVAFARGDSTFNESFATAVENEGMRRWLVLDGTPAQQRNFLERQRRKAQFLALVTDYRARLRDLYAQPLSAREKEEGKQRVIADLRQAYAAMKEEWGGYSGYDAFFAGDLNNARLGSVSLYTKLVPAFEALLDQTGRDLPEFYRRVKSLAHLSKGQRTAALEQLLPPAGTSIAGKP